MHLQYVEDATGSGLIKLGETDPSQWLGNLYQEKAATLQHTKCIHCLKRVCLIFFLEGHQSLLAKFLQSARI